SGCLGRIAQQSKTDSTWISGFQLLPNPASDNVICRFNSETDIPHIIIMHNSTGQLVGRWACDQRQEMLLPTRDLPQGLYVVSLWNDAGIVEVKKLVLSR